MISIPVKIPKATTLEGRIRLYLGVLYKFHKLTDKETDIVIDLIVKYYDIITKYPVHDEELINKLLFNIDVKKEIKQKHNLKDAVFQNYMTIFRKKGIIKDKGLNKYFIPPMDPFEIKMIFQ